MQVRIKRAEIEAFKAQGSFMKPNPLQAILSYIKIDIIGDFCEITKSNGNSFVVKTIQSDNEDCSFLVDENILYNFIEYSSAEYIQFEIEGNRIKISGDDKATRSPTESSKGFPMVDTSHNEWISLPKMALTSAGICANLIFDGEIYSAKSFVFIGRNAIAGCDGMVGYLQMIKEDVPELVLRKEVAICISKMNTCATSFNESYDLFKDGDALFGFIKNEMKFYDMKPVMMEIDAMASFSINKNFLLKFNNFCVNSANDKTACATFKGENDNLHLQLADSKMEFDATTNIRIVGCQGYFKFNPSLMNQLLKALPIEECYFYPGQHRYYISDSDKTFISAIMEMI